MPPSRAASARRNTGPVGGTPRADACSPLGSPSCLGDGDHGRESWWMLGGDGTLRA